MKTNPEQQMDVQTEEGQGHLKRVDMRPRVVMLDDCAQVLQLLSSVLWDCWPQGTIVACTDSHKAWEELQRTPPELFITDLTHGGISGIELLARLAEQGVRYPIVVLSGNLHQMESEVRHAAGPKLKVSCWAKPINGAEFGRGIKQFLEQNT